MLRLQHRLGPPSRSLEACNFHAVIAKNFLILSADCGVGVFVKYLRMCFPSIQQNVSPLSLLPSYIAVLGKKIDSAEGVKDLEPM